MSSYSSVISATMADTPSHVPTAHVPMWCAMSASPYQSQLQVVLVLQKCPLSALHAMRRRSMQPAPNPCHTLPCRGIQFPCAMSQHLSAVCVKELPSLRSKADSFAAMIGEDIFQQKIFFISVHSEVTCSDLFAGKGEDGSDVAVRPEEFMNYLFSGGLQPLVNGATIFMLSCGLLVAFSESVCSLKKALLELRPTYAVAFGAKHFISAVIKSFIVAFGVQVVIQGHNLGEVFKDLLDVSVELPMHTDMYIFQVKDQMAAGTPSNAIHVSGTRYTWFHSHRRPWGNPLPMSCPNCSSIHSWSPSKSGQDQSGAPWAHQYMPISNMWLHIILAINPKLPMRS
ncbi:hypothetical protein EDC04DRAFT_2610986 [Pisolithus marmoratus]|nr:hypothetical protein EDC04DRAFT_2610986 [Pisolithus marmoratus]